MKKRILAMALTAAMMISLFPASVFALPESQPTASSSEIVAQLNESASGDSQPAASEKTNSEPTAASEKAASSEATSSEATSSEAVSSEAASSEAASSEATSSEAASSEAASSEAASSEAVSSEPAQAEGDISVASENGERKINLWPFCPPGQWVYVYTKVTGNTAGLVLNSDGYYTLGKVWVKGMPSPKKDLNERKRKIAFEKVKAALGSIERYKDNTSIVLTDVAFDNKDSLIREPNGAADYVDKGYTWHLDGKLDVKFYGTVTFKHVDQDTGKEFAKQTSDGTLYPAGTNLQFGKANAIPDAAEKYGYEYVDVEPESYTVQGQVNKEITVKYKKVMTDVSYTVEYYKDNVQQTADTVTISSKVWVKDKQEIAIDASAAPSATRYDGYELEKVEPEYPAAGTMVRNGTVYKAYYKKVLTQLNTLKVEDIDPILYDGQEHKWVPTVTDRDGKTLTAGTDYDVEYDCTSKVEPYHPYIDVSDIKVTITGKGSYTGKVEYTYSITPRPVTLTSASDSKTYDGTPLTKPDVTVTGDGFVAGEVSEVKATGSVTAVAEGKVTNTITFTRGEKFKDSNYAITKTEGTLTITPATLTITTKSASKTYDGSDLTAKGYSIAGLVNGETVNFSLTGRQKEVGSSDNTYVIDWDKSTAKQGNYTIVNKLGKLTVEARKGGGSSGGGSSSGGSSSTPTPAPEQAPTPTPVPVIVPAAPTPAPTPVRRVAPAATATPAPTAKPTETIAESEPPKAESEPEVIEDEETPLAPMANGKWALVNLVLMILTVLASLLMLLGVIGKKRGRNNKSFWRIASLIPAIGALAAFVLTENMKLPMAMVDRWTLLMVIIAVLQLIVAAMSKKQNESEDDGANA